MHTETSRVLYSCADVHQTLLKECERVAKLGGYFTVSMEYTGTWYTVYRITYPEKEKDVCKG